MHEYVYVLYVVYGVCVKSLKHLLHLNGFVCLDRMCLNLESICLLYFSFRYYYKGDLSGSTRK